MISSFIEDKADFRLEMKLDQSNYHELQSVFAKVSFVLTMMNFFAI